MGKRILVVDDNARMCSVVSTILTVMGGYDVQTASSGPEALEVVSHDAPDVILMDVMMPEMDGPTVIQHLRESERTRDIPVILLTARHDLEAREEYARLGVAGLIPKPFDPSRLTITVSETLGG
jgi:CheY-like chemotaxis protein